MQAWQARHEEGGADVTELIGALGRSWFASSLLRYLSQKAPIDFFSVYDLPESGQPTLFLSASTTVDCSPDCFSRYRLGLSARDRTFDRAKALASSSVHAMNYWHESEFPQAHRAAIYSRHQIRERLSLVDESNSNRFLALNLYRYAAPDCLEVDHIDAIEAIATAVLACVQKHIEISERAFASPQIRPRESLIDLCPVLTTRELDTCVGLLLGRTYDGIAADLDLSVATVKTYRMRAFDKLGVHSRAELYAKLNRLIG
jgi:DNA-binding CsgD family transcriptional regulator